MHQVAIVIVSEVGQLHLEGTLEPDKLVELSSPRSRMHCNWQAQLAAMVRAA